jgi:hypothetical protein
MGSKVGPVLIESVNSMNAARVCLLLSSLVLPAMTTANSTLLPLALSWISISPANS